MDLTGVMHVLDRNACRSCRRPIMLIKNIGWLHGELPQYASEDITCDDAMPADPRCPHCDNLVPASAVADGYVRLVFHVPPGMRVYCQGSNAIVPRPA